MKKFELTDETKTLHDGTVLHRIKALVRIESNAGNVEVGDIGGWIEKEENLSHYGDAWVFGNAEVFDNASVYGNAWVSGNAEVFGNARVYGNAWVYGNAEVYCDADVFRIEHYLVMGPIGSRNAFTTFFRTKDRKIKVICGCFFGTIDEFLAKVKLTHGDSKHAKVYQVAVKVAIAQLEDVERRNNDA